MAEGLVSFPTLLVRVAYDSKTHDPINRSNAIA